MDRNSLLISYMETTRKILVLEDDEKRIRQFLQATKGLGDNYEGKVWRNAYTMRSECEDFFPSAALISIPDRLIASFLAECRPVCPIIIHTSNTDQAASMENDLRFADWITESIVPTGENWIEEKWLKRVRDLLACNQNTWPARLPPDHDKRMEQAKLALDGLSVGDGFGECFFGNPVVAERRLEHRDPPPAPWKYTDDTTMALSITRCLQRYGYIQQDALAATFAREYKRDPRRGYGGMAHSILQSIWHGTSWKAAAGSAFDGQGSCGNGGAMRAAPVGAYFVEDISRLVSEASASAEVTHAHADGKAGAIAVALAAAWMLRERNAAKRASLEMLEFLLQHLPETETFFGLKKAMEIPVSSSPRMAALKLGNGSRIIASDTVPFCLWCAAKFANEYPEAVWAAASVFGDIDTNCAIVGGIVALSTGRNGIPGEWLQSREALTV